jgi:hypothetical protein
LAIPPKKATMSTSDPVAILRQRTADLEEELRRLDERRREQSALEGEKRRVTEDLAKSRTLLDRFQKKRALPMLEDIRIASPCSADWKQMVGDHKSRFCGQCEKNVYNLSAMTREEAELLVLSKEGNLCIQLWKRRDGTVITADCPVGARRKRMKLAAVLVLATGLATSAIALFAEFEEPPPPPVPPPDLPYVMTDPPPPVETAVPLPERFVTGGAVAMPHTPIEVPAPKKPAKLGKSSDR